MAAYQRSCLRGYNGGAAPFGTYLSIAIGLQQDLPVCVPV